MIDQSVKPVDPCDDCQAALVASQKLLDHEQRLFKACEARHHEACQENNTLKIENARLRTMLMEAVDPATKRPRIGEIRKECL